MKTLTLKKPASLRGTIRVPGDKSISHRSIMLGAIAEGTTEIDGFLDGADCRSTISCFRRLGIEIRQDGSYVLVKGKGLHGLTEPSETLDVGNSGTTTRLLSGILAGYPFKSRLSGDDSINRRPMRRIIKPLSEMGAEITSENGNDCCPLILSGGNLHGIDYVSPVASAQIKSCVLFAGMYADSPTSLTEPSLSRNHSELMLKAFGADLKQMIQPDLSATTVIQPEPTLKAQHITVPGDISSAAYFIAAGLLHPDAGILIENVNINPTRAGILTVCTDMGANLSILNKRSVSGEEVCDLYVSSSSLHGCTISGNQIPTLIDEIPVIAVMAACAEGETVISGAAELRVKESDRIETVTENLRAMGADITPTEDGMIIRGGTLHGTKIKTHADHRLAMAFAVAALCADSPTVFDDPTCVSISYPSFFSDLKKLCSD